jgi:hypothetical protein
MTMQGWRLPARSELSALVTAAAATPLALLLRDAEFDATAPHPTPVVLIPGLLGNAGNFLPLRRVLAARGISNVRTFSYLPRIDVPRIAHQLGAMIEGVCDATGAARVDVVGHSLGGLVGRYLLELDQGFLVRRLVTLGAPYFTASVGPRELAIFAAQDPIVPPPHPGRGGLRGRTRVVPDCGHLGLLYHLGVLGDVTRYLARRAEVPRRPRCDVRLRTSRLTSRRRSSLVFQPSDRQSSTPLTARS